MSEEVERKLIDVLEDPTRSPFGNPIPALDELGYEAAKELDLGVRVNELDLSEPVKAEVVQINEILQLDSEQYSSICRFGITRGTKVTLTGKPHGAVTVTTETGSEIELTPDIVHALRVKKLEG